MGLDIRAFRKITAGDETVRDEDGDVTEGWFTFYVNPDFPERADGLKDDCPYKAEEEFHFRAGSYGGYNQWRNDLALTVGWKSAEDAWAATSGPLWELINFSDCEGVIGPTTSKKLADEFANFQSQADAHPDDRFRYLYSCWRKAFEMASDDGCVRFA